MKMEKYRKTFHGRTKKKQETEIKRKTYRANRWAFHVEFLICWLLLSEWIYVNVSGERSKALKAIGKTFLIIYLQCVGLFDESQKKRKIIGGKNLLRQQRNGKINNFNITKNYYCKLLPFRRRMGEGSRRRNSGLWGCWR